MRSFFLPACLLTLVALSSPAKAGESNDTLRFTDQIAAGCVQKDSFYAVTHQGKFVVVNLKKFDAVKEIKIGAALAPYLDIVDGKACVASSEKVYLVDLTSGEIVQSMNHGQPRIFGLGIVKKSQVFVQHLGEDELTSSVITVFDMSKEKKLRTFSVAGKREITGDEAKNGSLRIVKVQRFTWAIKNPSFALVDLDKGASYSLPKCKGSKAIVVQDQNIYTINEVDSYGVRYWGVSRVDAKTGKVEASSRKQQEAIYSIECDSNGDVITAGMGGLQRYDAKGNFVARVKFPMSTSRLVGAWNGQAIVAEQGAALHLVELTKTTVSKTSSK